MSDPLCTSLPNSSSRLSLLVFYVLCLRLSDFPTVSRGDPQKGDALAETHFAVSEQVEQHFPTWSGEADALPYTVLVLNHVYRGVVTGGTLFFKCRGLRERWRTTSPPGKSSNISALHNLASNSLSGFSAIVQCQGYGLESNSLA